MAFGDDDSVDGGEGTGFDPSYNPSTGTWSESTTPVAPMPQGGNPVQNTPVEYQSNFLQRLYDNPDTDWSNPMGEYSFKPLDEVSTKGWDAVKAAGTGLADMPSWGFTGGNFQESPGPSGEGGGFTSTPFYNKLKSLGIGVGRALLNTNPIGRLVTTGYDMATGGDPLRSAMNLIPGVGGQAARTGVDIARSSNPMETGLKALTGYGTREMGTAIGGNLGGGVGAFLGGIGAQGVQKALWNPNNKTAPVGAETGATMPVSDSFGGSIANGLGSLYFGNQSNNQNQQQLDQLQQQQQALQASQASMPSLASMYGPDSSYATQMRQALARKDAAAGRNSQYGPREVQLQAMLADKASTYAAQQSQAQNQYNASQLSNNTAQQQLQLARQKVQAQQLGALYNMGDKSGLFSGLGSMWDNWQNNRQAPQDIHYEEA